MQYHRIRLLLLLLLILPVTAIIFFSEGCEKKESTDPKPFKTEPVEEKKADERERRIQSLENICADITGDLTGALSELKLSNEERRLGKLLASSPLDTKSRIALGNVYLSQRRYHDAEREFRRASDVSSGTARALCLLAMTAYIKGDWLSGEKLFNEAINRFPGSPEPHVVQGDTWMYLWNLADAGKEYEKALALKKNDSYLIAAYGDLLCRNGKYEQAEKQYRDALACSPKEPIILEKLGNLALMGRKKEEAEKYYADSAALSPQDPLIVMKTILAAEGDTAMASSGKAVKDSSDVYRDYFRVLRGQILLRREQYSEAAQLLQGPFRDKSLTRISSYPCALALFRAKKEKEAFALLDRLIEEDCFDSKALALRAWLALRMDNLSLAIVDSAKSADIRPCSTSQQILQSYINSQVENIKRYDLMDIIRNYEKQDARSPEKEAIHYTLGVLLMKAGEYAESLKHFRMAADSSDSFYMRKIASILANGGNGGEALAALGKALEKNRNDFVAEREKGALYLRMKKGKEALALFSSLSQKEKDDALILYFEALALRSTGQQKKALSAFARACEMDRELPAALFEMAEIYQKLNNRENALQLFQLFDRQERIKALQDREKLEEARKRSEQIKKEMQVQSGESSGSSKKE